MPTTQIQTSQGYANVRMWIEDGGKTVTCAFPNSIADRITQALTEEETPFLLSIKDDNAVFTVRDINQDALRKAEDLVRFRLNQAAHIYSYSEFRDLIKRDASRSGKRLAHIEGLSEVEATLFQDELLRYSGGTPFALARMKNDTFSFAFRAQDMKVSDGFSRRKKKDVLTLFAASIFHLYGPGAEESVKRAQKQATTERVLPGARTYLLTTRHPYLYLYDEAAPTKAVRIGKEGAAFGHLAKRNGEAVFSAGNIIPYDNDNLYPDSVYRFIRHASVLAYTREEAKYIKEAVDRPKAKASKLAYLAYMRKSLLERIWAETLTDLFWETQSDIDILQDPDRIGEYLSRQQIFLAQALDGFLDAEMLSKAEKAARHVKLDPKEYKMAAERFRLSQIFVFEPEEDRISVDRELKRIKKQTKYNDHGLDAQIRASQDEAKRMQEDRFARVNGGDSGEQK